MRFDPARIFQILDDYGVDYLTIGGWAVVAHGYVRAMWTLISSQIKSAAISSA